jgi:GT2 family glycosyltransferase
MPRAGPRVAAVVVTWNRRDLLLESLAAIEAQSVRPETCVVVDNASTDGSAAAVRERFPQVRLLRLGCNTGGAGGFAAGIAEALTVDADLIWLMDDDTVPHPDALEALLGARTRYTAAGHPPPAVLASSVVWTDGRRHPMNTPRPKPLAGREERAAAEQAGCIPIRSASFVSVLVDAAATRRLGAPVADYFLWNDDFEFTTRLIRSGPGLFCPASRVVHKTREFGSTDSDPGARFYYEVRNKVWMFSRSRSLAPWEKVLFGGSTLRRWARTLRRSRDRPTLWRGLRDGLRDGLRTAPRPNADVLAAARADRR